jgi:hypothetical protein
MFSSNRGGATMTLNAEYMKKKWVGSFSSLDWVSAAGQITDRR